MKEKLFYTVVEDYEGQIEVCSFTGKNRTQEREFALSGYAKVHCITEDYDEAQGKADWLRAAHKAVPRS